MMKAGYDPQRGELLPGCVYAMLYVRWHFFQRLDLLARKTIDKFCTAAYDDDLEYLIWVEKSFSVNGDFPAPAYVPPITGSKRDMRLVGNWLHTSYLRSGGSSLVTYHQRSISTDGRFLEHRQSSFSTTFTDSFGNWAGWSDIYSQAAPGSKGRWATYNGRIVFLWDSNHIYSCPYEVGADYHLLTFKDRKNTLWKRSG